MTNPFYWPQPSPNTPSHSDLLRQQEAFGNAVSTYGSAFIDHPQDALANLVKSVPLAVRDLGSAYNPDGYIANGAQWVYDQLGLNLNTNEYNDAVYQNIYSQSMTPQHVKTLRTFEQVAPDIAVDVGTVVGSMIAPPLSPQLVAGRTAYSAARNYGESRREHFERNGYSDPLDPSSIANGVIGAASSYVPTRGAMLRKGIMPGLNAVGRIALDGTLRNVAEDTGTDYLTGYDLDEVEKNLGLR